MKILYALHRMMDLGGIINHTEQLIGGLKDLGHEVDLKEFIWRDAPVGNNKSGDWNYGPSGIPHDQKSGWNFKQYQRVSYRGASQIYTAVQMMCGYDMIIWGTPVPTKSNDNLGNNDWPYIYELPPRIKQVAFVHDGNSRNNSSHMVRIQNHLAGIACVHPCALGSSSFLTRPRALILNPQMNPVRKTNSWSAKKTGFVNMQTFKAWKHAHELVQAIAYMPNKEPDELREVAGEGIEYRYMTSEEKCRADYFHSGGEQWFDGWKFWDAALGNDMIHHGYWNTEQVDEQLFHARVLVDPSWSNRYSMQGGHFNRVAVDMMIRGGIVVGREKGMGSDFFVPGEHYVDIPEHAGPQEYADIIQRTSRMSEAQALPMLRACYEMLPLFDRKRVAQRLIELAEGRHENTVTSDKVPADVAKKADDVLFNHFGI